MAAEPKTLIEFTVLGRLLKPISMILVGGSMTVEGTNFPRELINELLALRDRQGRILTEVFVKLIDRATDEVKFNASFVANLVSGFANYADETVHIDTMQISVKRFIANQYYLYFLRVAAPAQHIPTQLTATNYLEYDDPQ